MPSARRVTYAVTAGTYRGQSGWHARGRGEHGHPTSIFVRTRIQAIAIRDALRRHASPAVIDRLIAIDRKLDR